MTVLDAHQKPSIATPTLDQRLAELHEMLYRRGGIRPTNAAVEELSKLLLLQLKRARDPAWVTPSGLQIEDVLNPDHVRERDDVDEVKAAFQSVIRLEEFASRLPCGRSQPVWPLDEPAAHLASRRSGRGPRDPRRRPPSRAPAARRV